jgi:hypothetical protein
VQQAVAQLPWGHKVRSLDYVRTPNILSHISYQASDATPHGSFK